jgi:uncharacterized membrane protein YgaE (UPF0421/DUF939 family)
MRHVGGLPWGERLAASPRAQMAVKAALAAALSWVAAEALVQLLHQDQLAQYRYYAPLGAVVATYPTLAGAVRTAWSALWALALGAGLGLAVHAALDPGVLSLALAVGLGVGLGALPGLGEQRSWVPIVALFVLVIGGDHTATYATAYVVLTGFGALCGVLLNVLMPALPLGQSRQAIEELRERLSGQLEELAEALRLRLPTDRDRGMSARRELDAALARLRSATSELSQAERGNPRRRWHRTETSRMLGVAAVLERVAALVEDLVSTLAPPREYLPAPSFDEELARAVAEAVDRLAALVRCYDPDLTREDPRVHDVEEAMNGLVAAFGERRDLDPDDIALIGAVVANLRWATSAIKPL